MAVQAEQLDETEVLEEMIRAAKSPEPGTLVAGDVIQQGEGDEGRIPPTVVNKVTSAGYVFMYDTETGEESISNRNMLIINLNKKRPDGSRVFTTKKPKVKPRRGTILCILHPDQPWRAEYDKYGFARCNKSNIANHHQQTVHMKQRHREEYLTIQEETLRLKEDKTAKYQDAMIVIAEKALAGTVIPPAPVTEEPVSVASDQKIGTAPFLEEGVVPQEESHAVSQKGPDSSEEVWRPMA